MPAYALVLAIVVFVALRILLARRTVDATPLLFLRVPLNALRFRLRRALRWRRGLPEPKHEDKAALFEHATDEGPLRKREAALRKAYALAPLHACSTNADYRENLYVLDLLDRFAAVPSGTALRAIDVGSKDFRYAFALTRWLERGGAEVTLTGIELDGHPVYADLHSRADYGEAYAKATGNPRVTYVVADFLERTDRDLDVVFCFFPFVLRYALVRWGLPLGHFLPTRFFTRAKEALSPGGLLVVVNHTREEHARQLELLAEVGFEVEGSHPAESALVDYAEQTEGRMITLARRPK